MEKSGGDDYSRLTTDLQRWDTRDQQQAVMKPKLKRVSDQTSRGAAAVRLNTSSSCQRVTKYMSVKHNNNNIIVDNLIFKYCFFVSRKESMSVDFGASV